jgi:FKBP-type peptidyl-prolyl cis-trans isomerase SlpA
MESAVRVTPEAHLTLHYRLRAEQADGSLVDVISTHGQSPATLQLGSGQLSPGLEARLIDMKEGETRSFHLGADEAFGPRNEDLVQRLERGVFDFHADPEQRGVVVGETVALPGPGGGYIQGLLVALDDDRAIIDFNHPLAGRPIEFDVRILGVL